MRSPLAWIGGKRLLARRVLKALPEHRTYVEPFCGAGWVFFSKEPSKVEVLNDINGDLVAFWRVVQRHLEEFLKQFKFLLVGRETFADFKQQLEAGGLTDVERAARFYYLQRCAFGGKVTGRTFGVSASEPPRINLLRMEEELSAVHLRLAKVTIEHLSWEECLRRYDRPETCFYIDPPYVGSESDYGAGLFSRADHARLAAVLRTIQGRFILSYNAVQEIITLYDGFTVRHVDTQYSVNAKNSKKAAEVLICNGTPAGLLEGAI
ncbi:DNA adenine methylase [Megalodesulfovibrio gigas]|uniref:site-specific DNA-methyltransferase (adenine-specific) n=1 Tax=Megalodesulfovibrio gigas (strain ATCC 19364 / DSM 1382 / NCIMB 9332 / VKM B-1759) TaxID=1121448 RepID=T2GCV4_MEGG1|nr:DNA adenine methylase [Megalodesulfovibrio gigas]AGW14113.1 putative D12 class N6 adenine-specific DNA methyltransferase [Megalodesulfovibrio gigas DSM 1382 = ATCC 19364]